ncbi:P-loop containing nucleoside triphosphate hydrolase protein [Gymnopus androsaceus JB14]|uniref:P-loop containing nucleoside triphosphate hydrolase protein n=1 Tax=Gymnopus androsaceus JB14 TaxID=1447944 RepID=A0A6A4IFJ0_9AGAR|nr:P-loop containing nucleoside triphosphate hydrolase protein [Gymnopus androsaceus JB14]
MGSTGTGKSSFINLLTGNSKAVVGHNLESETEEILRVEFTDPSSGRKVVIFDTPGFDDSKVSDDTDILKRITKFLLEEYDENRKLNGLVYVQRISDTRFSGQSKRNLRIFKELCGTGTYKNMVVLTTFWDKVSQQEGDKRELELRSNYFEPLVEGGATFMRHTNSLVSAQRVVEHISTLVPTNVQITKEIREEGKTLEETAAGSVRREEVDRLIAQHREEVAGIQAEMNALKSTNEEMRRELAQDKAEMQKKLATWEEERAKLARGLEEARRGQERSNSVEQRELIQARIAQKDAEEKLRQAKSKSWKTVGQEFADDLPFLPNAIGKPMFGIVGRGVDIIAADRKKRREAKDT